jgi:hypothetical protein
VYDEELTTLDEGIRRLKIEYDIFFSGNRKKPPDDLRLRVEKITKRLAEATDMSLSQRFRYNTLIARFYVYRDLWRRTQQDRESAQESAREMKPPSAHTSDRKHTSTSGVQVTIGNPEAESDKIQQLYEELLRIRGRNAKGSPDMSYQQFTEYIASQILGIKHKHTCSAVTFRIALEQNSVKFTAKADQARSS